MITLTPVSSSQIHAIGHDAETNTLAVQFPKRTKDDQGNPIVVGGSIYHYQNFPADKFEQFMAAESKGTFFGAQIKKMADAHPFTKQEADAA